MTWFPEGGSIADAIFARTGTKMNDEVLAGLIAAAQEEIEAVAGPAGEITVAAERTAAPRIVTVRRPIAIPPVTSPETPAITSILERRHLEDATAVVLMPDDYRQLSSYSVLRLGASWGAEVAITYQPAVNADLRTKVLINLIILELAYSGYRQQSVGGGQIDRTRDDYGRARKALLSQLGENRVAVG